MNTMQTTSLLSIVLLLAPPAISTQQRDPFDDFIERSNKEFAQAWNNAPIDDNYFENRTISACGISSNDEEMIITLNVMRPITPENISIEAQGNQLKLTVKLDNQRYAVQVRSYDSKTNIMCRSEKIAKKNQQDATQQSLFESHASSINEQLLPMSVTIANAFVEIDGTLLLLHIPRAKIREIVHTIPVAMKKGSTSSQPSAPLPTLDESELK